MKAKLISLFICSLAPLFLFAEPTTDKIPYNLHDEHDKTDIYAIPLDSSEEDQDEEEDDLEDIQRYEQEKTAH